MTVADVLADAVDNLDGFLTKKLYNDWYDPELRARIIRCRNEMARLRTIMDSHGAVFEPDDIMPEDLMGTKDVEESR